MKILTRYILIMLFFSVLAFGMFILIKAASAPENEDTIIKTLESNGFSDVKIIEKDIIIIKFSEGDPGRESIVKFTATAKNSKEEEVKIRVDRRLLGMP